MVASQGILLAGRTVKWKRGDLVEVYDTWADSDAVYCLPRNIQDAAAEIPQGSPVLILDPDSEEGFKKYGDHSGEKWMLVLWKEKEWFVYASDLSTIKRVREQ